MMKEKNSKLIHFQNCAKLLTETPWFFSVPTNYMVYMGSSSKNQLENILLPWIRKYGFTDFYVLFCLVALIFQHGQNFSTRGFVFPDRLNTLHPRPRPKSLCSASLRNRFPDETLLNASRTVIPWIADISANPDPFLARIRVSGPPKHPWSTAQAEIAVPVPRRPVQPILNLGVLCCWRGAATSVDILASTSPFRAQFRVLEWKIRVWHDSWETWSASWKKRILLWVHDSQL